MVHRIKTFGVALIAAAALSSVAVSAASAVEYHTEFPSTILTGKQVQQHVFSVAAGAVKCTTATFAGSAAEKTVKSILIIPTYSGCTLAGAEASVKMNLCTYIFQQPETATTGKVSLKCGSSNKVEIVASTCTITVFAQGPLSKVTYGNTGSGATREVDITSSVENISYTQDGTKCLGNGAEPEKSFVNGKYTGTTLMTGEAAGSTTHTGIWIE